MGQTQLVYSHSLRLEGTVYSYSILSTAQFEYTGYAPQLYFRRSNAPKMSPTTYPQPIPDWGYRTTTAIASIPQLGGLNDRLLGLPIIGWVLGVVEVGVGEGGGSGGRGRKLILGEVLGGERGGGCYISVRKKILIQ